MQQIESDFFESQRFNNYDYCYKYKDQVLSTHLVAMKNGEIYPVSIKFTKQCTPYFIVDNKELYISTNFYFAQGYATLNGYKVIDTNVAKLNDLLTKEQTYLRQCQRGIELATQRIANFTNLKTQHPELFI